MEILHLLRLPGVPHVEKEEQEQGLETMGGGAGGAGPNERCRRKGGGRRRSCMQTETEENRDGKEEKERRGSQTLLGMERRENFGRCLEDDTAMRGKAGADAWGHWIKKKKKKAYEQLLQFPSSSSSIFSSLCFLFRLTAALDSQNFFILRWKTQNDHRYVSSECPPARV